MKSLKALTIASMLLCGQAIAAPTYVGTYACQSENSDTLAGNLWADNVGLSAITVFGARRSEKVFSFYPRVFGNSLALIDLAETGNVVKDVQHYSMYISINRANLKLLGQNKTFKMSLVPVPGQTSMVKKATKYSCDWK